MERRKNLRIWLGHWEVNIVLGKVRGRRLGGPSCYSQRNEKKKGIYKSGRGWGRG